MSNIKSSLLVFSLAVALSLPGAASERYDAPVDMVVADSLNVRSSPSIASDNVMGMLGTGTEVQALGMVKDEDGKEWVIITYNGEECYISADYVTSKEGEDTLPGEVKEISEEETEATTERSRALSFEVMDIQEAPDEVPTEVVEMETLPPMTEEAVEEETKAKKSKKKKKKETEEETVAPATEEIEAPFQEEVPAPVEEEEPASEEKEEQQTFPTPLPEPTTEGTTAYVRQTSTYANGEVAGPMEEKTIVKTEDVPSLKNKGHGYVFTTFSNGSIEVMIY